MAARNSSAFLAVPAWPAPVGFFHSLGFRPGRPMAIVAGASEAGAGVLLALGLLTPLASAAVIGTLVVASSVHWASGLWAQNGGYELPLIYAVTVAAAKAHFRPGPACGPASGANAFGLGGLAGGGWGAAAVIVGAASRS